ncbi:PrsW family intramembrane metalloprotease [Halodesulfurarchaeum formicicum]|uniref:Protease PrsW n=1 Tax=Halodesulfurarchaeum formicicum TaxID=1873524 RepID=A0A1J1AE91_9EURY|nr:PrsW family intramembrane metalloprotease [Halodesulfurarchaeum formicicum]APE96107.1 protease PrsW [Halodesulfurarchaeum formicicum]
MGRKDAEDPIQWAADEDRDLQEIATWEPRTTLDGLATVVHRLLLSGGRAAIIGLALAIVAGQFAITVAVTLEDPILAVYFALSIVPALGLVVLIWRSDVVAFEPIETLSVTFLLGFLFAGFAAVFNSSFRGLFVGFGAIGMVFYFLLVVGPIEETVKLLAVRLHAYRSENFDAVIDGAIYGAVAGLGFAAIENVLYITQGYMQVAATGAGGLFAPTAQTAAVRSFAGPGHVIYSAFAGYYLGLAKFNPAHRGPLVIKGLLVATGIHATYNILVSNLEGVLNLVPILGGLPPTLGFVAFVIAYDGLFFAILYGKLSRYRRTFESVGAGAFYDRSP